MLKFKYFNVAIVTKANVFNPTCFSTAVAMTNSMTTSQCYAQPLNIEILDPITQFSSFKDPHWFISYLINCKTLDQIHQIHAQTTVTGMISDLSVANKLLYIYAQWKCLNDAHVLFEHMYERDAKTWSIMMGGFAKVGDHRNSLLTFREIIQSRVPPDNFTLPFALRTCRDILDVETGKQIHPLIYKVGLQKDLFVSSSLVDMYAKCGSISDARTVFDKMKNRDMVTWTVMISGYANAGIPDESLDLFDQMIEEQCIPDKIAMVTIVFACAKLGILHKARMVHEYIKRRKFSLDVILGTAMIDMYSKCGSINDASEIFYQMKEKNVITWSTMISAYGIHGYGKKALDLFPIMLQNGIIPNRITFISILSACSHVGLVDEGQWFFHTMSEHYSIPPDIKHYTCMVDLLGRAGKFDEAMDLIDGMKVEKDEGLWGSLLGACRIHGNIDLAEKSAKCLLQLEPRNPGYYVLLSNIYANAGKWADVAKVRESMSRFRLKKVPGRTWIEINNKTYQFGVGDKTHPQSAEIYEMLKRLSEKLESVGYIPDTSYVLHDVDEEIKVGILYTHGEKLAIAFGLISTMKGTTIRMIKNLRICAIVTHLVNLYRELSRESS